MAVPAAQPAPPQRATTPGRSPEWRRARTPPSPGPLPSRPPLAAAAELPRARCQPPATSTGRSGSKVLWTEGPWRRSRGRPAGPAPAGGRSAPAAGRAALLGCWLVDEREDPAVEGRDSTSRNGDPTVQPSKQALAAAQEDREQQQPQLVDQALVEQVANQGGAAGDQDVLAELGGLEEARGEEVVSQLDRRTHPSPDRRADATDPRPQVCDASLCGLEPSAGGNARAMPGQGRS